MNLFFSKLYFSISINQYVVIIFVIDGYILIKIQYPIKYILSFLDFKNFFLNKYV